MTGIALGGAVSAAANPSIKLRNVNDWCDLAVVDQDTEAPAYVYGTNPPQRAVTQSGKPKTQDKVTAIVVNPGSAVVTVDGVDRPVETGEIVTVWFAGRDRWDGDTDRARGKGNPKSWRGAQDDLGRALNVGDIFRWHFTGTEQGRGAEPRKLRLVVIRAPKPEEQAIKERCEELYRAAHSTPVAAAPAPDFAPF